MYQHDCPQRLLKYALVHLLLLCIPEIEPILRSPLISTHKKKFQEQRNIPIHSTIPRCRAFFQSQFKLSEKRENITIENHMTTTGELPRSRSLLIPFEGTVKHLCSTLPQKLEILTSKIMTRGYPAGQQHQYYKISFLST